MKGLNSAFDNYAISIVILTVLIRLAMLPLDLNNRRNQAKMSALGPEIQSLQKRYANNPQMMQKKQRELYARVGYRPMMGCIPMLIQLPFLFAFFGAMRVLASEQMVGMILNAAQNGIEAVQLPGFLWVHNFWQADSGIVNVLPNAQEFMTFVQTNSTTISPETMSLLRSWDILTYSDSSLTVNTTVYNNLAGGIIRVNGLTGYKNGWFILPALCGAALFLQQKFAPQQQQMNPMMGGGGTDAESQQAQGCSQKAMLWIMPIFSIYICAQSSSTTAFALYWFVSSIYAFGQMQVINLVNKYKAKKQEVIVT